MTVLSSTNTPCMIALAGSNGAGKSTFYHTFLQPLGLPFINADLIAKENKLDAYSAAAMANTVRKQMLDDRCSFVFETVFSDPCGDKVHYLNMAVKAGFQVMLVFIGIGSADISDQRVSMRVTQGGHDVPQEKLSTRYPRTLKNLQLAVQQLPLVYLYDNDDLVTPYRFVAQFEYGHCRFKSKTVPDWARKLM